MRLCFGFELPVQGKLPYPAVQRSWNWLPEKSPGPLHSLCLQSAGRFWQQPVICLGSSECGICHQAVSVLQLALQPLVLHILDFDTFAPRELLEPLFELFGAFPAKNNKCKSQFAALGRPHFVFAKTVQELSGGQQLRSETKDVPSLCLLHCFFPLLVIVRKALLVGVFRRRCHRFTPAQLHVLITLEIMEPPW